MADAGDWKKIIAGISDEQVLRLEQAAIRIPSTTFEEGALADHFATYLSALGLDVEMMEVTHWAKPGKKTRQPIARLRGTGGGRALVSAPGSRGPSTITPPPPPAPRRPASGSAAAPARSAPRVTARTATARPTPRLSRAASRY